VWHPSVFRGLKGRVGALGSIGLLVAFPRRAGIASNVILEGSWH
jgi:hypothetical protein